MAKKINSNSKGKRFERMALTALKALLGIEIRRTAQVDGSLSADLTGWGGVYLECKHYAKIAALNFLRQAEKDAETQGNGDIPIVLMRENGDQDIVVMYRLKDTLRVCERVAAVTGPIVQVMPCQYKKADG